MNQPVVLVTGACGDIGTEIAIALARIRARLILTDHPVKGDSSGKLIDAVIRAGGEAIYFSADVTDRSAIDKVLKLGVERFGPVDICIANAAVVEISPFLEVDPLSWKRQLDINLTGCFHVGQAAALAMVAVSRPGRIIFISSWVQDVPWPGIAAYCVSKSGLKHLAKCMALELAKHNINVNLLAPGFVDAGLSGRHFEADPALKLQSAEMVPLGYIASAEDVASAVMLLCSPGADYMTGATLLVDGGNSLFYRKGHK